MKRTCLISCALGVMAVAPTTASAEPGILYIPTDPVTLRPTGMAPCGADVNSALGCGGASEEIEEPPYADAENLTMSMAAGLANYDVMVTNARPPEYIHYLMMLPSEDPIDMESALYTSFTCSFGGINCGARNRNDIIFTSGNTENCIDPEIVHAAMYTFGRASGLEGIDNPEDWMNYIPDYTTPPMDFMDVCNDRLQQQGFNDRGMQVDLPLECTSVDHAECPDGTNGEPGQNSHQDLLLYYGPPITDADPPELANIVPEDGAVLMQGEDLVLDVDITDNDVVVGARWTVQSQALEDAGVEGGLLTQCTNDVCDANWPDAIPLKATDSDWAFSLSMLPAGEYNITLEAADYHGNVAEMVAFTVTIEGMGSADTTGGGPGTDTNASADTTDPPPFTTGEDETGGDGETTSEQNEDPSGCSCRTTPAPGGAVLMLLGLMGLGTLRRRQ